MSPCKTHSSLADGYEKATWRSGTHTHTRGGVYTLTHPHTHKHTHTHAGTHAPSLVRADTDQCNDTERFVGRPSRYVNLQLVTCVSIEQTTPSDGRRRRVAPYLGGDSASSAIRCRQRRHGRRWRSELLHWFRYDAGGIFDVTATIVFNSEIECDHPTLLFCKFTVVFAPR